MDTRQFINPIQSVWLKNKCNIATINHHQNQTIKKQKQQQTLFTNTLTGKQFIQIKANVYLHGNTLFKQQKILNILAS